MLRRPAIALLALALAGCGSSWPWIERWQPEGVDQVPDAVANRLALPFCGVDQEEEDHAESCFAERYNAREAVEFVRYSRLGPTDEDGLISIIRGFQDGSVEMIMTWLINDDRRAWSIIRCPPRAVSVDPEVVLNGNRCDDEVILH